MGAQKELDGISRMLSERAEELRDQIRGKLGEAADSVLATDRQWSDASAALAEAGVEYAEAQRDIVELRTIEQVMSRIGDGGYGICEDCGANIPPARLRAQPMALTCVACQSLREKRAHT